MRGGCGKGDEWQGEESATDGTGMREGADGFQ